MGKPKRDPRGPELAQEVKMGPMSSGKLPEPPWVRIKTGSEGMVKIVSQIIENRDSDEHRYTHLPSGTVCNRQKVETTQMTIHG